MTGRIDRFEDLTNVIRTFDPARIDYGRMTDNDLERLSKLAVDNLTHDANGMNEVEGWAITGHAVADAGLAVVTDPNPIRGTIGGLGALAMGASNVLGLADAQQARAERLNFMIKHAGDELSERNPAFPIGPPEAPARNYDGEPENDVAPTFTWDDRPAFETVAERRAAD